MHGTTVPLDTAKQQSMARLEALARLMDGAFVLPGTTIRFGLDGIIGLIPVAGDMIAGLVSTYLIWEARQLGAPSWLIARMLANAFLDTTIGADPGGGRRVRRSVPGQHEEHGPPSPAPGEKGLCATRARHGD